MNCVSVCPKGLDIDDPNNWREVKYVSFYAGTDAGAMFVPETNTDVLYDIAENDAERHYYYIGSFVNSLILALISTFFCLLIGFPLAFYIATSNIRLRNILLVLVVIPFWSSFLLRVYAWKIILQNNGILNVILLNLGITSEPLQLLYNQYAVIMGIVYTYLPLMILPLYGYLNKFDLNLIEASKDLGLNRIKTFFKVILPLSVPGIVAGSLLVFIPVVGEFIIPEMLGGSDRLYYGKILWEEFFVNRNWPGASALAFSGIIILVLPIVIFQILYSRWSQKNEI